MNLKFSLLIVWLFSRVFVQLHTNPRSFMNFIADDYSGETLYLKRLICFDISLFITFYPVRAQKKPCELADQPHNVINEYRQLAKTAHWLNNF